MCRRMLDIAIQTESLRVDVWCHSYINYQLLHVSACPSDWQWTHKTPF